MAKLHVEIDGPILQPGTVSVIRDGVPLTSVSYLAVHLDADSDPAQVIALGQVVIVDGQPFRSDVSGTITKATLTIEYQEA
jgi:hypothetical protein